MNPNAVIGNKSVYEILHDKHPPCAPLYKETFQIESGPVGKTHVPSGIIEKMARSLFGSGGPCSTDSTLAYGINQLRQ